MTVDDVLCCVVRKKAWLLISIDIQDLGHCLRELLEMVSLRGDNVLAEAG